MNQAEYYETHPPRCIAGFAAESGDLADWQFDGHGSDHINTVFLLTCSCGSDGHFVFVHPWTNPDDPSQMVLLSPIALQCAACKKLTELIDTAVHGYDAELGLGSTTMRGEGVREQLECGGCDLKKVFQVFVRFEYPDDLFDDFKDRQGRQQDLFTWFSLVAKCVECSAMSPVADFECA
jgi:hypothetical protein